VCRSLNIWLLFSALSASSISYCSLIMLRLIRVPRGYPNDSDVCLKTKEEDVLSSPNMDVLSEFDRMDEMNDVFMFRCVLVSTA